MPNDFANGMQLGLTAYNQGQDNNRQDARLELEKRLAADNSRRADTSLQLNQNADARAEIDSRLNQKTKNQMIAKADLEARLQKDEMDRLTKADQAWNQFRSEIDSLDTKAPDYWERYSEAKERHLPDMLLSKPVATKFNALDGVKTQAETFLQKSQATSNLLALTKQFADLFPGEEAPKKPDGTIDTVEAGARIRQEKKAREEELFQRNVTLRRTPIDARVEAEQEGAYGGRNLDDVDKAELQLLNKQRLTNADARRKAQTDLAAAMDPTAKALAQAALSSLDKEARQLDERVTKIRQKTVTRYEPGSPVADPAATPMEASGEPPTITTRAEFDKLPSGATYKGKDGRTFRKP